MIKLKEVIIYKYKSIENEQKFEIEPDVTVLVGMNESGKTNLLEALAKVNYFDEEDKDFNFDMTRDYPRKQKKAAEKLGDPIKAVKLTYEISQDILKKIQDDIIIGLDNPFFSYVKLYNNHSRVDFTLPNVSQFLKAKLNKMQIEDEKYISMLSSITNKDEFNNFINTMQKNKENEERVIALKTLEHYFLNINKSWSNPIEEYVWREYIKPNMPKFMYYDDYYMLPSRISIDRIHDNKPLDSSEKTARALLELADIDTSTLINATSYEDFKAELEATQASISEELFKYWSTNKNLRIQFDIDKKEKKDAKNNQIIDHVLDIRVSNLRSMVSLPLANRSKGFNWFFSFLVWFEKIQEDKDSSYILLLDEPGLNLHAMAQHDLLRFIDYLSKEYQIIYTTHSPFMIESDKLQRVRTVIEKEDGTHISDCLQEKDPNTLFPLQAALGYTIAQNLFVSENNLLVEGISDLTYLTILSNKLSELGRTSLKNEITIVPVGGADKIATFISLLRGNDLNILCLLDTFTDQSARARLHKLTVQNIIKEKKIIFYHDILNNDFADIEDLFTDEEYLKLYNGAFGKQIDLSTIVSDKPIMKQLKAINDGKDFNHYSPASYLANNITLITFSDNTLNNFEKLFKKVNEMF